MPAHTGSNGTTRGTHIKTEHDLARRAVVCERCGPAPAQVIYAASVARAATSLFVETGLPRTLHGQLHVPRPGSPSSTATNLSTNVPYEPKMVANPAGLTLLVWMGALGGYG